MRQSFPNMNKRQLPSHWLEGPFRKVEHLHTLFKVAFQCKWLSSPLYNYVQAHRDNLLPTGWMERTWEAGCLFFHIPNDRKICRIYSHHQKNVLILLQCIAMWEERKIHIVPISLWLSVLYTKFHPSKKKTYFCPRRWQWPLVRHQLAFAFTSESSPFLSSCWLSFIQIYVSKMKDDTLMLCKCW